MPTSHRDIAYYLLARCTSIDEMRLESELGEVRGVVPWTRRGFSVAIADKQEESREEPVTLGPKDILHDLIHDYCWSRLKNTLHHSTAPTRARLYPDSKCIRHHFGCLARCNDHSRSKVRRAGLRLVSRFHMFSSTSVIWCTVATSARGVLNSGHHGQSQRLSTVDLTPPFIRSSTLRMVGFSGEHGAFR